MKHILVRYTTKPEQADTNQRLIEAVFRELRTKQLDGVRYLALRLGDGTFVHFATADDGSGGLTSLDAFRDFQAGIKERCIDPPQPGEATIIGDYRMLEHDADTIPPETEVFVDQCSAL